MAWSEQRWRNVPEGKQVSDGVTLTWNFVELFTRPKITQKMLIVTPQEKPNGTVILFPGEDGAGIIQKRKEGGYRLYRGFLVRSAHRFARAGFTGVILDAPSDYSGGMSDEHRQSRRHLKDVAVVIDYLANHNHKNILLVGTSRATLSVGYLGTTMKDPRIKGIVLTSSMNAISSLPLSRIQYPVLVVHHIDDGCHLTRYRSALLNFKRLDMSPRKHFLTVSGGIPPQEGDCYPMSRHGFLGVEEEVVQAIVTWGTGKSIPLRIGDK